jgi:hypothetical protein
VIAAPSDPRRVSLRSYPRKGFTVARADLPADVVNVARPSRYGNLYRVGDKLRLHHWPQGEVELFIDRPLAVALYRHWLRAQLAADPAFLMPLYGKRLACWDDDGDGLPCHVDVLLEEIDARVAA